MIAIDHTYDAGITELPGGRLISWASLTDAPTTSDTFYETFNTRLAIRVADIRFLLDSIAKQIDPLFKHIDITKVGIFGHSFGAEAALQAAAHDERIQATAVMDLFPVGQSIKGTRHVPCLSLNAELTDWTKLECSAAMHAHITEHAKEVKEQCDYHVLLKDADHMVLSDFALLSQMALFKKLPQSSMFSIGSLDGLEAIKTIRTYLVAFFDKTLKDKSTPLLGKIALKGLTTQQKASVGDSHTPKISVNPEHQLFDEQVEIIISDLAPHERITIEASCTDITSNHWKSNAVFQADEHGVVKVAEQSPISGSYNGIDAMGLFWSMVPFNRKIQYFPLEKNKLEIQLSVFYENKQSAQKTISRLLMSPDIEERVIREHGVVGTFFWRKNMKKLPSIIVLPGSSGGIPETKAKLLASHGYTVLALGYFGLEGLPENLDNIPLEYFQNALQWMKRQSAVDDNNIALFGASRGGELALLLAATFSQEVQAVIADVPSGFVYSGFPRMAEPAWTYKGVPIPFMPSPSLEDIDQAVKEGKVAFHAGTFDDPCEIAPHFLYGMEKFHQEIAAATIPVENIRCPILLLSGNDDKLWPSHLYCKLIMEHLEKEQSPMRRKHLNFTDAGHILTYQPPYLPVISPVFLPEENLWSSYGGTIEGNAHAAKMAWKAVLEFLKETLVNRKK